MIGKLYIVATPIGNLEDITLRALRVLKEVDLIAAEDTRQTLKLLNHYEINKPLISYHRHNEETKSEILIEKLRNGENIALVSDAGTPGICDPGEEVIKKAIEDNIEVIPIPGACAMINALIVSGISTKEFEFLGFLPLNKKLRRQKLKEIENSSKTIIIYEAPHKMKTTLGDLKEILKDRKIVLARELTKIHEEFIRKSIDELLSEIDTIKGEMILIIEGNKIDTEECKNFDEISLEDHYKLYEEKGLNKKEIDHLFYEIRSCNPFPCNMYNTFHDDYVSPDILIEVENSDITITPINQPALMVNDTLYEKVKNDENMKAYFNEAHFLMENMTKRNQTVLIVANALVNIQSGYFLYDDELYPCTLSQLASETGFHESTISRTLNNKYYSFNGEAYPLKKLLVSQTASGDSSDSIKKAIVELVDDEDKEHPLSDNQILKKLEELELHCSRRVIVKYRQQLNIPSSTKRKMLKKVG